MVAAESFGLGTVPIGDIQLHAFEAIWELNLPQYVVPMLGLCVGYPGVSGGRTWAEAPSAEGSSLL